MSVTIEENETADLGTRREESRRDHHKMGRISTARIEQIGKLRRKGYLQKEVADKLGLDVKTVRKYDPLRGIAVPPSQAPPALLERLESLERRADALEAWRWMGATAEEEGPFAHPPAPLCPVCYFGWGKKLQDADLEFDEDADELVCTACHRRYPMVDTGFLQPTAR